MSVEGYWLKLAVVEGQRKRRAEVVRSESQAAVTNIKSACRDDYRPALVGPGRCGKDRRTIV
jgi:hypothetical protein